jgi:hypothetical protein
VSPEEYRQTVSEGFHEAGVLVGQVLVGVGVLLAFGVALWVLHVRQVSLANFLNRLLPAMPSSPGGLATRAASSLARAALGSTAALSTAAALLAYGSIPVAVILGYLNPRRLGPLKLRDAMLSPARARELLTSWSAWR